MALLLAALLLGGPITKPALAHPSSFPDVSDTNPAHDAIESLAERQIVAGDAMGYFHPDNAITRGEAAKTLVAWRGREVNSTTSSFADVGALYLPFIEAAVANKWMNGYPDGSFRPDGQLTKQQMTTILVRILGLEGEALSQPTAQVSNILGAFTDGIATSSTASPYMALAVSRGLITEDGGRLRPGDPVTRAQFSLTIYRAEMIADGTLFVASATGIPADNPTDLENAADPKRAALAEFMDVRLFGPHNSPVTGEMVLQNADWYGIPPLSQLVIMAAETSLGDPKLGGTLARSNNFGCMRYHGGSTPWGQLSDGRIWVAGKDWYSFASPQIGMAAWGRYLKSAMNGFYVPILSAVNPDWDRFAAVYYGRGVSGFSSYVHKLHTIENRLRAMASEHGVSF